MAQNHRGLVGSARGVDSWSGDHNKSPLICIFETALCTNELSRMYTSFFLYEGSF